MGPVRARAADVLLLRGADVGPESLAREDVRAQVEHRIGAELARQVYGVPAAVQARVVEMLAAYWEQSFAEEWSR